jgi:FkbM family methyltransferase
MFELSATGFPAVGVGWPLGEYVQPWTERITELGAKVLGLASTAFRAGLGVERFAVKLHTGQTLELRSHDVLARRLVFESFFEPQVRDSLRMLVRPGATVLDLGANIGYFSVLLSSWVGQQGRVLAFEPQPVMQRELRRNLMRNGISNVSVFGIALGEYEGTAEFCLTDPGFEAMGSLRENGRFRVAARSVVPVRQLDTVLAESGINTVEVIKMDTEGAELSILKGATRLLSGPKAPAIVLEAKAANAAAFGYSLRDLRTFLESFGYGLASLDEETWLALPIR